MRILLTALLLTIFSHANALPPGHTATVTTGYECLTYHLDRGEPVDLAHAEYRIDFKDKARYLGAEHLVVIKLERGDPDQLFCAYVRDKIDPKITEILNS